MASLKEENVRRFKHQGPLHDLLLKACPPNENGVRSISILAKKIPSEVRKQGHIAPQTLFKYISLNRIPPKMAVEVVNASEGRVTLSDFSPFIFL